MLIEGQEFFVPLGPPRKGIDAIKSLDVIDPEQMKDPSGSRAPVRATIENCSRAWRSSDRAECPSFVPIFG